MVLPVAKILAATLAAVALALLLRLHLGRPPKVKVNNKNRTNMGPWSDVFGTICPIICHGTNMGPNQEIKLPTIWA